MKKNEDIFTQDILRKIKRAYFYRTYLRPVALEVSFLAALIGVSAFFVSLRNIFSNAYSIHSFGAFMHFSFIAFRNTSLSVKTILVSALVVGLIVLRDVSLGLRHMTRRFSHIG